MEIVKLSAIEPDSRNANRGTERGRYALERSLEKLGAGRSILLDKNGKIIAGNKTAETAGEMGIEDVVIVRTKGDKLVAVMREDLDLDEPNGRARALAYADNRVGQLDLEFDPAVISFDLDAGLDLSDWWSQDELDLLTADIDGSGVGETADAEPQTSRADELQQEWGTATGQLWKLPSRAAGQFHLLVCGDCTDRGVVERVTGGGMVEMVCTDPPYGVSVGDKNKYLNAIAPSNRVEENLENDTLSEPELEGMLRLAFANAAAFCLAGGAWYVAAPAGPLHVIFGQALKDMGIWRQTIQWVKNNATFAPLGVDYHWRAEPIFYGWLPGAAHRYHGGRQQDTVWEIDRPLKSPEHPTMKPVELIQRMIENSSRPGEMVLDPFCGSGTAIIASENLGRCARAIEVSSAYVAVALQRYLDSFGITPELIG